MSLSSRIEAFEKLASRFQCFRPSALIASGRIPLDQWKQLQITAAIYLSKNLPDRRVILDEETLLRTFLEHWEEIKTVTPNGIVVPKRNTMFEYNALVRAFADIMNRLNIGDLILSWHIPLNLRIKPGCINPKNLQRHHPTEHNHSDSWAGESAESVTVHIPLMGDTGRNRVVFYEPPEDFQEDWLKPLPSYIAGAPIAAKYKRLDYVAQKGDVVLADFSTLHSSSIFENASPRVSIDTTFVLKKVSMEGAERIHPWRIEERASHQVLLGIGETHLLLFPDPPDLKVDSQGGFKHPTNLKVIELVK